MMKARMTGLLRTEKQVIEGMRVGVYHHTHDGARAIAYVAADATIVEWNRPCGERQLLNNRYSFLSMTVIFYFY
jgi:hypothetical protein